MFFILYGDSLRHSEAAVHRCSSKLVFLKISQYSQENTCVGTAFFIENLRWLLLDKLFMVSEKLPPGKLPPRKLPLRNLRTRKLPPMKIPPYEYFPLWKLPLWKLPSRNLSPRKLPSMKIPPPWNPLPTYKSNKCKKKQNYKFFVLKKAVQHNILIKITKVFFDTEVISQRILGLDTFFTE